MDPKNDGRVCSGAPLKNGRRALRTGTLAVLLVTILGITMLWTDLRRQQEVLVSTGQDSALWAVGQSVVEFQSVMFALQIFGNQDVTPARLDELRRCFDVFYNRIDILLTGALFRHLLDDPDYAGSLTRVRAYLDATLPVIDGDDAALASQLPEITESLAALEPEVRNFVLLSVHLFSERASALRLDLSQTMDRVAWLSAGMLMALLGLSVVLFREIKTAENGLLALQRSAARLDTILSTSNDAIVVTGMDGRIVEFNRTAQTTFGLTSSEALNRPLRSLLVPASRNWYPGDEVGRGTVEMEARNTHNQVFPVETTIEPIETDEGPLLVAFFRDITIRKAAQAELIDARDRALAGERAKADFVAVMSHELRSPLNGLLGMLSLLRSTHLDGQQRDYVQKMETSGQILLASVDDVLEISQTEAGRIALTPAPTALKPLLRSVPESQSGAAAARGNRIRFVALTELPHFAMVDAARLRQVLVNLIGNAIKFTEGGEIVLEAEAMPAAGGTMQLLLRVSDTGIGIAAENLGRIFEDFETLDPSLSRQQTGAGLGLAIVRRLVQAMDGEIEVESELGEGSIFTLTLPLIPTEAPVLAPPPAQVAPRLGMCRHVLVVEDDDVNRAVLGGLLERRGCQVTHAASGLDGIAEAKLSKFDLVLMDLSMPGLDGVEAARRIRQDGGPTAKAPIYLVTAHSSCTMENIDGRAQINGVLTKPVVPAQIDALLNRAKPPSSVPDDAKQADLPDVDTAHLDILRDDLGPRGLLNLIERFSAEAAHETLALSRDAPRPSFRPWSAVRIALPVRHRIMARAAWPATWLPCKRPQPPRTARPRSRRRQS